MARPLSWLTHLHQIRLSVSNSVRSHYERQDIETLFGIRERAAQNLLDLLPTTKVGRSLLVAREDLKSFLDRIHESDNPQAVISDLKSNPQKASRKKLRTLVQKDAIVATIGSLPENLTIEEGRVEIRFETVEELATLMYGIAQILDESLPEFEQRFLPRRADKTVDPAVSEVKAMFADLEEREAQRR